jgi:hypothetical protein
MTEEEVSSRPGQKLGKISFQGLTRYTPNDNFVIRVGIRRERYDR